MLAALILVALAAHGCGGGSVCGNGKAEPPDEQCDDGNDNEEDGCSSSCRQLATRDAQLIWTMLEHEADQFNESCSGVGAKTVQLDLTGPSSVTLMRDCGESQYLQSMLQAGHYTVTATLLDAAGVALTKGKTKVEFDMPEVATGTAVQVPIDFGFDDFVKSYQGNWLYRLRWGGAATCGAANPPVAKRTIRLERDGQVLTTGGGVAVDGATAEPCTDTTTSFTIADLTWGPMDVIVTGLDASDTPRFRETFHSFSGARITKPIILYDVASLDPDAGVPDAAVADAAPAADAETP
jgi:cysteine-rich repeat protein